MERYINAIKNFRYGTGSIKLNIVSEKEVAPTSKENRQIIDKDEKQFWIKNRTMLHTEDNIPGNRNGPFLLSLLLLY